MLGSYTDKGSEKMGFGCKKLAQLFFYKEKSCIFVADFELLALAKGSKSVFFEWLKNFFEFC